MSFERLLLLVGAKHRAHAKLVLDLAQAITAGQCDVDTWTQKQRDLIEETNIGLE